jgi:hypothetical protein
MSIVRVVTSISDCFASVIVSEGLKVLAGCGNSRENCLETNESVVRL